MKQISDNISFLTFLEDTASDVRLRRSRSRRAWPSPLPSFASASFAYIYDTSSQKRSAEYILSRIQHQPSGDSGAPGHLLGLLLFF